MVLFWIPYIVSCNLSDARTNSIAKIFFSFNLILIIPL